MLIFTTILACNDKAVDSGIEINLGPVITFDESALPSLSSGDTLSLSVVAEDDDGVGEVKLYYRQTGAQFWENMIMSEVGDAFTGSIESVNVPGVDFYFRATDSGNPIAYSLLPVAGAEEPFSLSVEPVAQPLPFFEDFELEAGQSSLIDRDWWTPSDARDTFAFDLSQSQSQSGQLSVFHPRGSADVPEMSDWLISPPLDFSSSEGAMVGWWERVSASDTSSHSLWVSTGSRLPEDGDYVEVSSLEPFGIGGWARYRYIDLSEFSEQSPVYVAWRWEGTLADDWYIDDVEVRSLGPDLLTDLVVVAPEPLVAPGDSVTLEITIENLTAGAGDNLQLSLGLPEGGGQFEDASPAVPEISPMGTATVEATLNLDADLAENRYLPISVSIADDVTQWESTHNILIGVPSMFDMALEVMEAGEVKLTLGVGEPDNPSWSEVIWLDDLDVGSQSVSVDVTDQFDYMPPQAGTNRWFVNIESEVGLTALTSALNYGETVYSAQENVVVFAEITEYIYIPEPPSFSVLTQAPSSTAPGDTDQPLSLYVQNVGADPQGEVSVSFSTQDPDLTIVDGENIVLGTWPSQSYKMISGPLISVSSTHVDSSAISLLMTLSDSVESWEIPFEVPVPWPVLKVVQAQILDGNDGVLEANEDVQIELTVANIGGLSAFGVVSGNLSLLSSSTAGATITNSSPSFGFLSTNDVDESDDFYLSTVTGSDGDVLELELELTDGSYIYSDTVEITLGEPPWLTLSPFSDSQGDVLSETAIDIERVDYRLEAGNILAMRIRSATPIDQQTAFLEAWGMSGGADYTYFRWVLQSGVGTLQGYNSGLGFMTISDLDVNFSSSTEVILRWDVGVMGLAQDSIDIGIAAGWCGPPSYFCDHYPDGWGYPYVAFSAGLWYNLSF